MSVGVMGQRLVVGLAMVKTVSSQTGLFLESLSSTSKCKIKMLDDHGCEKRQG